MRILVDVGHPGQFHLHRNAIRILRERGHEVLLTARNKDILIDLIERYQMPYRKLSDQRSGLLGLSRELFERVTRLRKIVKEFKPDIMYGAGETVAIVGKLTGVPTIVFTDTENLWVNRIISFRLADTICVPIAFKEDPGKRHIRYDGNHELAYLHPNYFKPDPSILELYGLDKDEKYIIVRFVEWKASHDIGQSGFKDKVKFIKELEKLGRVIISSEKALDDSLKKFQLEISPDHFHHILAFATLYIGEGATIASEAAVLGVHALYLNTLRLGYTDEEEEKYNLVFNFPNPENRESQAIEKAKSLLKINDIKNLGKIKNQKFLNDKIDVTKFLIWFIEGYPDTVKIMSDSKGLKKF